MRFHTTKRTEAEGRTRVSLCAGGKLSCNLYRHLAGGIRGRNVRFAVAAGWATRCRTEMAKKETAGRNTAEKKRDARAPGGELKKCVL